VTGTASVQGYCVSCRAKRELSDVKQIERSGLPTYEGKCAVCGSKIFVLGADGPAPANPGATS
jgi:hypothetical protein